MLESFGDPADKRIKIVKVTPLGEELCLHAIQRLKAAGDEALSGLTETEKSIFVCQLKRRFQRYSTESP